MSASFSILERLRSFRFALRGLAFVLRSQHNAWVHALVSVAVLACGFWLDLSRSDWCWLTVAIVSVWSAEAMNTAIEQLADATCPDPHPLIGNAKDAAAGAVLLTAIGALVIGVLVLGPPLWARL